MKTCVTRARAPFRLSAIVATAAVVVGLSACGGDEDGGGEPVAAVAPDTALVAQIPDWKDLYTAAPAEGTYVGTAGAEKSPSVGFVVQNDKVVVYVCDGKKVGEWFGGEVKDGRFDLESEGGTRVEGEVTESEVKGTLTLRGGSPLEFTAAPAEEGKTGIGVGAGEDQSKRRWIATADALRGVDEGGGGSVKNGVAVTQTPGGSGSVVGDGGGGGSGQQQVECHNFVTAGCSTDCSTLARERDLLKKKNPQTKDIKIQISNYNKQFGVGGGCIGPPI